MRTISLLAALLLVGTALPAQAQSTGDTWKKDRFYFGLGLYRPNMDTQIRVDDAQTGASGTLLNLERDLDLSDRKTQTTIDAHFRFAKRHALEFEHVKLSREDETNIGFQIDYDGEIIGINEDVRSTFSTEVSRLAYRFSFINSERMELSAALGLHITDLKVGLNIVGEEEEFNDVTAPLPTLGAAFKYHFNEQLTLHLRGEWLDIEIDNVNGKLTAGVAELIWYPFRNFGASIGYDIWDLSVKASEEDLTGRVEYRYDGPKLTLRARF